MLLELAQVVTGRPTRFTQAFAQAAGSKAAVGRQRVDDLHSQGMRESLQADEVEFAAVEVDRGIVRLDSLLLVNRAV